MKHSFTPRPHPSLFTRQISPTSFVLVAGALTELLLSFRPVTQGLRDIKVHLVDTETRELVYALLVTAEAQGPLITRSVCSFVRGEVLRVALRIEGLSLNLF